MQYDTTLTRATCAFVLSVHAHMCACLFVADVWWNWFVAAVRTSVDVRLIPGVY